MRISSRVGKGGLGLLLGFGGVLRLAAGCTSFHGTPLPDAAPPPDVGPPPGRCLPTAAFGTPEPVIELNTEGNEVALWMTPDELRVYVSHRAPGRESDIRVAVRANPADPFGELVPLNAPAIQGDGGGSEEAFSLTAEERRLFLERDGRIMLAVFDEADAAFGAPQPFDVPALTPARIDRTPFVPHRAATLYFARSQNLPPQIYRAALSPALDRAEQPQPVSDLERSIEDDHPVVTPDERAIFFRSVRPGNLGDAGDIWMAERLTRTGDFGSVQNLMVLNSEADDYPLAVTDDGCVLYFASSRLSPDGSAPGIEIWRTRRGSP
jgi:hypothetical protein